MNALIARLCIAFCLFYSVEAFSANRVAFIVGNNNYENVASLEKAVNDANSMSTTLEGLGFAVTTALNLKRRNFNRTIQTFTKSIKAGDVALFFYAGHGVEINGLNYLLPTDIPIPKPGDEDFLKDEAISLNSLLRKINNRAVKTTLVILDACRDNPLVRDGTRSLGGTRGLASINAPQGTFIMYSAAAGQTALDRLSDNDANPNSVFTRSLIPLLKTPNLSLIKIAKTIRNDVKILAASVSREQRPAYYDDMDEDFFFSTKKSNVADNNARKPNLSNSNSAELAFWDSIKNSKDVKFFQSYLKQFPDGIFASIAKLKIEKTEETRIASLPKAPDVDLTNLMKAEIKIVQSSLAAYDIGPVDGKVGKKIRSAITQYNKDWELSPSEKITQELMARLNRNHPDTKSRMQKSVNSNCSVFNQFPEPKMTLNYIGNCVNGLAQGEGTLI